MTSWTTPPPGPEPTPPVPQEPGRSEPAAESRTSERLAQHAMQVREALLASPPTARERPEEPVRAEVPPAPAPAMPVVDVPAAAPTPLEERPIQTAHEPHPAHHPHLPAGAHVGDRRGLTATGAVALALSLGLLGAFIDVNTGSGLRTTFAVMFVLGSGLAALLVHREDIKATVVMPPLTYCVLALVGSAIGHTARTGSFVKAQAVELVASLTTGAPVLYAATGSALLVALVRAFRSARQPSGPSAAPAAARTAGSPPRR